MGDSEQGRATVLVVDEDTVVLDLFDEILSLDGYRACPARNPQEALALLEEIDVALVISEYGAGETPGNEFYRLVTRKRPHLEGRFIFTSREMDRETTVRVIESTGVPVIGKPFEVEEVRKLVSALADRESRA